MPNNLLKIIERRLTRKDNKSAASKFVKKQKEKNRLIDQIRRGKWLLSFQLLITTYKT